MDTRRIGLVLLMALAVALGAGCKKSQSDQTAAPDPPAAPAPAAPKAETVARIHWLGKKRIAAETNAAYLMGLWNLPESEKLKEQTLNKLSSAPWRLWKGGTETNAAPTALLRALLDDLLEEESYLEARSVTNQPVEIVFAIRLSAERAGLWHTNLAAVTESLTGERSTPTEGGWSLKKHDAPDLIELARAGDWMVVGLAQKSNTLVSVLKSRIQHNGTPL